MADGQNTPRPRKKPKRRRGRRERSLAGTNLFREVRTDVLIWRRVHPITGKRVKRNTKTKVLEYALARAAEFEDELQREIAGLKSYDGWTRPLLPLVDEWFADMRQQDCPPQEQWLKQKHMIVVRALETLKLERAADLTDVGRIDAKLKKLRKPDVTLRRRYQDPLKQFSKWLAENGRYLERDPLSIWKTISYEAEDRHRAFGPEELARALVATSWLDTIHAREHPLRPVFTLLLVAAPRIGALVSRDVTNYLRDEERVDFGKGRGKKGRGQGKLDQQTAGELHAYVGERDEGPLVLSPRGSRIDPTNMLRWWREAFGLGLVWELWPDEEPWEVELGHLVNHALLMGEPKVPCHGNPNLVKKETRRRRRALKQRVAGFADELRSSWEARMVGVTLHAFRHTHQTWARAMGVDQVLINLQVGWSVSAKANDGFDVLRVASTTGLSRYLDARSRLLDARQSANAVRRTIDEALQIVEASLADDDERRSA